MVISYWPCPKERVFKKIDAQTLIVNTVSVSKQLKSWHLSCLKRIHNNPVAKSFADVILFIASC